MKMRISAVVGALMVVLATQVWADHGAVKDSFTEMELLHVKGGCYQRGDTFGDGYPDEKPVREVCLKDFYLGIYEVTQGEWQKVMGNNPSYFKDCGSNCPVERVSWNDTQEFIKKLNSQTGRSYRLPTEAEWEYAARSGGKEEKYAGTSSDSNVSEYAWYDSNSQKKTHPVGTKKPNGLGLYDMTGNVREWCQDWYGEKYYSESPQHDPQGPSYGHERVIHGGSWFRGRYLTASSRLRLGPATNSWYIGFRLALSAP